LGSWRQSRQSISGINMAAIEPIQGIQSARVRALGGRWDIRDAAAMQNKRMVDRIARHEPLARPLTPVQGASAAVQAPSPLTRPA